jgi:branched-chain amino acid transport system permease protein
MGGKMMAARLNDKITAALVALGICLLIYISLMAPLLVILIIVALLVVLLTYCEKTGLIDTVLQLMGRNTTLTSVIFGLFIVLLPFLVKGNNDLLHIMIIAGIMGIVALGLNFQIGGIGQINFAPAVFYGVGAYTTAYLSVKLGVSPWLGTVAGICLATLTGVIIGLPALKARGYYLALVTIALQTIFTLMVINTPAIGGPNGIPGIPYYQIFGYSLHSRVEVFGLTLPYQVNYLYLVYILFALAIVAASRLFKSRYGIAWNAVDQDPVVAATQGINLTSIQLLSFCLGAAFAGMAGALYAHYTGFISNENFDFSQSLILICMVILGGSDNVPGVITGALLLTMIDQKLADYANYRLLMYGLVLIIILLVRSKGLLPKRVRIYGERDTGMSNGDAKLAAGAGGKR